MSLRIPQIIEQLSHQIQQALLPTAHPQKRTPSASPLILVVAVTSVTALMGQRFYDQPALDVGRIAPETIVAPDTVSIEDLQSTEEQRKAARTGAVPVLKMDTSINQQIYQDLQRILEQGDVVRQQLGAFPILPTSQVSANTQLYVRSLGESDWYSLRQSIVGTDSAPDASTVNLPTLTDPPDETANLRGFKENLQRQRAITELRSYRQRINDRLFSENLKQLSEARDQYWQSLLLLENLEPSQGGEIYDQNFLNLMAKDWQDLQTGLYTALERILIQGFAPGTPAQIMEQSIRLQVSLTVPPTAEPLGVILLQKVLRPNLVPDPDATKLQAEQAAEAVEPVMVNINSGEIIVKAGETITQSQFVLLDHFNRSERSANWLGLLGYSGVVLIAIGIFWMTVRRIPFRLTRRDYFLVLLLVLSTPTLVLLQIPTTTLPVLGILIGTFYGPTLGAVTILLQAILLPLGLDIAVDLLLSGIVGGLVAAIVAHRLRSREEMALLGAGVGLAQGTTHLFSSLVLSSAAGQVWYSLAQIAAWHGIEGLAWCIVALGLSPYLEHLFDLVTPIRLSELSNPNRLLLQRLATQTPGTFQHTLFVASLAEAAARKLKCNVELVRAGTLYHDIGKMHDPLGFIENQMGAPNKHDEIQDPWQSATIIRKHVTEGLVMAKKCRLPRALRAFIPEHQGTMLISYFYHQAQQLAKADPDHYQVDETDFRYPGPIPQSRETGIVMLADSCEAALRSLKEATPEEALNMVTKIIRARWQEDQLVDSGLKREEMETIARVFVDIWQQFHHRRIPYPSASHSPQLESSPYRVPLNS
ncbi:MAG: HD family phosphohydrolase [Prochlorotrichaceae cyanobacterium]|jgi:putative nucleotidyltransferase with HDIG domain